MYIGGVDSESRLNSDQNPFLGKFEAKNLKLSVFSEHWFT